MKNRTAPTLTALVLAAITIFGIGIGVQAAAIEGRQLDINSDSIKAIEISDADIADIAIAIEREYIAESINDIASIGDINIADEIGLIESIEEIRSINDIRNIAEVACLDCVRINRICDEAAIADIV